ncbi:hypothetical protein ES703_107992 [subsurface metagenome]
MNPSIFGIEYLCQLIVNYSFFYLILGSVKMTLGKKSGGTINPGFQLSFPFLSSFQFYDTIPFQVGHLQRKARVYTDSGDLHSLAGPAPYQPISFSLLIEVVNGKSLPGIIGSIRQGAKNS